MREGGREGRREGGDRQEREEGEGRRSRERVCLGGREGGRHVQGEGLKEGQVF